MKAINRNQSITASFLYLLVTSLSLGYQGVNLSQPGLQVNPYASLAGKI